MRPTKNIKEYIKNTKIKTNSAVNEAVLNDLLEQLDTAGESTHKYSPNIWEIVMTNKMTRFAAAAVILIAVGISLHNPSTAYALEDTIKAYHSIRWLHINESYAFSYGAPRTSEIWLGCDVQGNITKMRFQSDNVGEPVGPLVFAGNSEKSEAWLSRHNLRLTGYGELNPNIFLRYDISELDPKFLFQRLYEQQNQGEAIIDIQEPAEASEPIVVTVTYPEGSRSQMWKKVIVVEKNTKLVTKIEKFELRNKGFELIKTLEFSEYNQPIDETMFILDNDASSDAEVMDLTEAEAGLPQGDLTEREIAEKITREFFEAAIVKDYVYAGQLYLAAPDFMVKNAFMGANIIKIISIGPAHRDPDPDSNAINCSCKVLAELGGKYYEVNAFVIRLIKVDNQTNRWLICGMAIDVAPAYGLINVSPDYNNLGDVTYNGLIPGEFMKKWLVLGPLPYPIQQDIWFASKEGQRVAFETDIIDPVNFIPEVIFNNGIGEETANWALLETNTNAVDLNQLDENVSDFKVAYVWSQIEMAQETNAILGIGSDDGIKVWLNGELVHANWLYRGVVADNDRVPVTFKKGSNQLVLKVQNALGPWGFCCRILDE